MCVYHTWISDSWSLFLILKRLRKAKVDNFKMLRKNSSLLLISDRNLFLNTSYVEYAYMIEKVDITHFVVILLLFIAACCFVVKCTPRRRKRYIPNHTILPLKKSGGLSGEDFEQEVVLKMDSEYKDNPYKRKNSKTPLSSDSDSAGFN